MSFKALLRDRWWGVLVVAVVAAVLVLALIPRSYEAVVYPFGAIPLRVIVFDRNYIQFDRDVAAVEKEALRLAVIFDRHRPDSEISAMNREAASHPVKMSADMGRALEISRHIHDETGGAFDPSVAPLIDLWKESVAKGKVPSTSEISAALVFVGFDGIVVSDDGSVKFARPGMAVDLGAVAKGYIVDSVVGALKARGVLRGIVAAGGDSYAFGDGKFKFAIKDPLKRGAIIDEVEVGEGAVMTSGNYERYAAIGGKKYSHIIDPAAGMPVENDMLSATVMGGKAADADALATAAMVAGSGKFAALMEGHPELSAVLVTNGQGGETKIWELTGGSKR